MNIVIIISDGYNRLKLSYLLLKKNIKMVIIDKLIHKKNNIIPKKSILFKSIIFSRDFKIFVNNYKTLKDTTVKEFIHE